MRRPSAAANGVAAVLAFIGIILLLLSVIGGSLLIGTLGALIGIIGTVLHDLPGPLGYRRLPKKRRPDRVEKEAPSGPGHLHGNAGH